MGKASKLKRLNAYFDRHKLYYSLLEGMLVLGVLHFFRLTYLLPAEWLTSHLSNFIGSAVLLLIMIGPTAFKIAATIRIVIPAIIVTVMNIALEFGPAITLIDWEFLYWENFNTPDPIDALFGMFAVIATLAAVHRTRA